MRASQRFLSLKPSWIQSEDALLNASVGNHPQDAVRNSPAARGLRHWALVAAFVGLFAAAILSVGHLLDLPVPCGASRGCMAVAAHPSSQLMGIPIAFFGVAAYITQIVLLGRPTVGTTERRIAIALAAIGSVVSAALLIYSHTAIGATCLWCVVSGVAMAASLVLGIRLPKTVSPVGGPRPGLVWGLGFATATAIGLQAGMMQRAALAPPVAADRLADVNREELVDPRKSIGPVDAAVTVITFADFLCPACRAALGSLLLYQKAHPNDVRVVYRHLPLWQIRGHETSKAAAALSEMAGERGEFWTFVHALHTHHGQMSRSEYLEFMQKFGFSADVIEKRLSAPSDSAIETVRRDIQLADRLGIQATPTFIVQVGASAPISATERGLERILNSASVVSLLVERNQVRLAQ
jgi:protein-disulfide isomerase/uncharacterized membrane protein